MEILTIKTVSKSWKYYAIFVFLLLYNFTISYPHHSHLISVSVYPPSSIPSLPSSFLSYLQCLCYHVFDVFFVFYLSSIPPFASFPVLHANPHTHTCALVVSVSSFSHVTFPAFHSSLSSPFTISSFTISLFSLCLTLLTSYNSCCFSISHVLSSLTLLSSG